MTFQNTTNAAFEARSEHRPIGNQWTARLVSCLPALFLIADAVGKLIKPAPVVQATVQLGYNESSIIGLGLVLLASVALYLIPRTAVLGAVLLTGYLGGAVATHVRVGDGWFNILFPVIFGCLLWAGLALRDRRLADLFLHKTR
jgi:hypothetical protein